LKHSVDLSDNASALDEVRAAINKLRNGHTAGSDGIPPELMKCDQASRSCFALALSSCMVHGQSPNQDGIIISLYKSKGAEARV